MKSIRLSAIHAWLPGFLLGALCACAPALRAESFFPDTGKAAITQHALELRGRLRVMSIALRPGEEDCVTLASLRMGRGALVTAVYVTNGEKGELDTDELLPFDVAATRRVQAMNAMSFAGADAVFLNMDDLDAALTEPEARSRWNTDTLSHRLQRVIEPIQPDLILLMTDKREGEASAGTALVRESLARASAQTWWNVGHVLIETGDRGARICTPKERHPAFSATFGDIGGIVRGFYASMPVQMAGLKGRHPALYAPLQPGARNVLAQKNPPLAGAIPGSLRELDREVRELAAYALRSPTARRELVSRILPVLRRVDRSLGGLAGAEIREKRIVLDWKDALEKLRAAALGVTVKYSLEYDVVCERQLVRLGIDEIHAAAKLGPMEVVVHDVASGWVLNESVRNRTPVRAGDTIRLISPDRITYDIPFSQNAQLRPSVGRPLAISLVHPGTTKEETFIYQITPRMFYAPRFHAEVLTPLVRGYTGERVVTQLTNQSRDGVADVLGIEDSLAGSSTARVALSFKGATSRDTLVLMWHGGTEEGAHLLPVEYGGVPVAQFVARTFACQVDTSRRIGVVSGWKSGILRETLRRLGFSYTDELSGVLIQERFLRHLHTVVLDRRALTLRNLAPQERDALRSFVRTGGHLVILSQESSAWNADPLWGPLRLAASPGLPPDAPVSLDTTDAFLARPNQLSRLDFDGWLNRRSYSTVDVHGVAPDVRIPVRAVSGMPLLVTAPVGQGRLTYVDLALGPQWMNVTPGACRLLANILSQ